MAPGTRHQAAFFYENRGVESVGFVVDDDKTICEALRALLEDAGHKVETYSSSEEFLQAYHRNQNGCLLLDAYLPGTNCFDGSIM
ncbi:MAG: response regulator [Nitrobacter sp.]